MKNDILHTRESLYQTFLSVYECVILENGEDETNSIRRKMKFQNDSDLLKYRSCIDLLEDTECAIISGFTFQLGNRKNHHFDVGEIYVRLYGILNAVSLQIEAIVKLANLINFNYKTKIKKTLQALDIYRLRNIAGAHTIDCRYNFNKNKSNKNPEERSFRIVMNSLTETGESIVVISNFLESETFNLLKALNEYEKESRKIILEMAYYSIEYFVNLKKHKTLLRTYLNETAMKLMDYKELDENKGYLNNLSKIAFDIE